MGDKIWQRLAELEATGRPYALVTVVRSRKPSSARPGMRAVVFADGTMEGFVGGQCTRPVVVKAAQEALRTGEGRLLHIGAEPAGAREGLDEWIMACASGGEVEVFIEPRLPDPVLVVVGDTPVAKELAALAPEVGFEVRSFRLNPGETAENFRARLWGSVPCESYAVVASQGEYDEEAVAVLLETKPRYLGLVASARRGEVLRASLTQEGLPPAVLDRVTVPAGLSIGALTPVEIAVAILAQLIALRRNTPPAEEPKPASPAMSSTRTVVDPVCGMSVILEETPYQFVYRGQAFGFCCRGCRDKFAADPERFVGTGTTNT